MAVDKLVDSTQLDSDLTSVANAIRAKSGGSGQLAFPAGFISEIGNIPSGETVYTSSKGIQYVKNVVLPSNVTAFFASEMYRYCSYMESISAPGIVSTDKAPFTAVGGGTAYHNISSVDFPNLEVISYRLFQGLPKVKNIDLPKLKQITCTGFTFRAVTGATLILGSIGHPVEKLSSGALGGGGFTSVTVYVNASSIADIQSDVNGNQPWGGNVTTIVYRSSVTGEVLS